MKKTYFYLLSFAFLTACSMHKSSDIAQKVSKNEPHRPKLHFTPPSKWMNDPNGMVYWKGEYHLFYQYYPDSTVWGPMHWGHAVSKDLVHWQHLPIALFPDKNGYIFSGSTVIDEKNTSGFAKNGETPLVAIFTYHDMDAEKAGKKDAQTQGIAYSLDNGRTWTKYAGNPVIKNPNIMDFRDPKVMWYAPAQEWIMTLAVGDFVTFYGSKDLKNWEKRGEFGKNEGSHGGVWECPDLFPITVEGTNVQKWVLIQSIGKGAPNGGSGTQYFVGEFDGKTFKNDNTPETVLWLDYGRDNYAGVTWFGAPNNRRLFIGWMSNWQYAMLVPTENWRSAMTLPRELTLKNTKNGLRISQKMMKELDILRGETLQIAATEISENKEISAINAPKDVILTFDLANTNSESCGIVLSNNKNERIEIGYDVSKKQFYIDRTEGGKKDFEKTFAGRQYAPRAADDNLLEMRIVIDAASVELLADDGSVAMTAIFFPNEDFDRTAIFSKNGKSALKKAQIWHLKPAF